MGVDQEMNNGVLGVDLAKGQDETHVQGSINGVDMNPRQAVLEQGQAAKLLSHFHYHKPSAGQIPCYNAINEAAKLFAQVIMLNTPAGPDQTAAVRKVVEAKMTANSAIATNPHLYQ